jgi:hypothetical protein
MMTCSECSADIPDTWDNETTYPNCGIKGRVEYDESWDSESGEESGWFTFIATNRAERE